MTQDMGILREDYFIPQLIYEVLLPLLFLMRITNSFRADRILGRKLQKAPHLAKLLAYSRHSKRTKKEWGTIELISL